MASVLKRIEHGLFVRSRTLPPPWGPVLRALRFPAAVLRDWLATELNLRAMSLAYSTLLSLVPLIAFSIAILKGLGAHPNVAAFLYEFFRPVGRAAPELARHVMRFVGNLRGDVLGTIGLAFLAIAVVSTMHKVEAGFNAIWRVTKPRGALRRLAEYLGVVIVSPVLLAAALGLLAAAHDSPFARWLHATLPLQWTFSMIGKTVPYVVVMAVFTTMYVLIPSTRVKPVAAIAGGVGAGVLWALIGRIYTALIVGSSGMVAIYTSFAVVLTTLIWLYLSWLILLVGAQLAFYVQNPQYLRDGRLALAAGSRERAAFSIMYRLGQDHRDGGGGWSPARLADALDIGGAALDPLIEDLEHAGLIATGDDEVRLGRDPRAIRLADVLAAVRAPRPAQPAAAGVAEPADALVRALERAASDVLAARSLADWVASS
ncbi:MAG: YihY/virulence factor BrkB family protein [Gammaproteobacteria bacterium]|nr:YihY/virulence factor BrkB family protein [Gammaproteobacteria bacterium]